MGEDTQLLGLRVLEASPDHISIVGSDYRYRYVNPEYSVAHGRPSTEIVGRHVGELLGMEAFERLVKPRIDDCLAGNEVTYDAWFHFSALGRRYMHVRYLPLPGVASALCVIATDLTERKHAEEALSASEHRYRAYIANAPHGVFVTDLDGRYVEVNEEACRMTGYGEAELLGLSFLDLAPPEAQEAARAGFQRLLQTGSSQTEVRLLRKDGSETSIALRAVTHDDTTIAFGEDVGPQRELEAQLRHAHHMDAMGLLAGGVAHDFNNLLTTIGGYASVLIDGLPEGVEARRDAAQIIAASRRAAALVQKLLTFARRRPVEPQRLRLDAVFGELRAMLTRFAGETVEVDVEVDGDGLFVEVDRGDLEGALLNLVGNARDAMPDGGRVAIRVRAATMPPSVRPEAAPGGHAVLIEVSDTGIGMAPDVAARVFDPFFTTKPPGKGTGLGLSTVYGFAQQAGGDVRVMSALGAGTCFSVWLPRAEGPGDLKAPTRDREERPGGGERILLVEDEDGVRQLVVRILKQLGYTVLEASRPSEALALLESEAPPELLLTDVVMPEMDGTALARLCHERLPGIRTLYISAYPGSELAARFAATRDADLLSKPFTGGQLARRVRDALDGVRREDRAHDPD